MTLGPEDRRGLTDVSGGVTAASGYEAAGIAAGLKPSGRPDLALVVSEVPAAVAVTLTTNRFRAAPCDLTARNAADGSARAVVLNSGNANACTGERGERDAEAMATATAEALGAAAADVLVCSTGIIGVPLDTDPLLAGIAAAADELSPVGGPRAARAIMTTDSAPKEVALRVEDGHGTCTVGAMAKGAGMIEPAMATMLAVITTDAPLQSTVLRSLLRRAVNRTFNRISIDACGSTNDTVIALANGRAATPPQLDTIGRAFETVCADLAAAIVADGEGTTKVAEVRVTGARREEDALTLARAICSSVLFRAALHGADPNWGRILAAMGATDVELEPARVSVSVAPAGRSRDAVVVCRFGVATAFDRGQAAAVLAKPQVEIVVDVGLGGAEASMVTADLTPEYVAENAYYTT